MEWLALQDVYDITQGVAVSRLKEGVGKSLSIVQTRNLASLEVSGELDKSDAGPSPKIRRIKKGDVLVNLKSIPVRASITTDAVSGSVASSNIAILAPKENAAPGVDSHYVVGLLRSRFVHRRLVSHMGGEGIASFNLRTLRTLQIPVPPFDKQQALGRAFLALETYWSLMQQLVEAQTERLETELESYLGTQHDT